MYSNVIIVLLIISFPLWNKLYAFELKDEEPQLKKTLSIGINPFDDQSMFRFDKPSRQWNVLFRKEISTAYTFRIGLNGNFRYQQNTEDFPAGLRQINEQTDFSIGLQIGMQRTIHTGGRTFFYAITDLSGNVTYASKISRIEITDAAKSGFGETGDFTETLSMPGVIYRAGFYPGIGFKFFLHERFSIGTEIFYGSQIKIQGKGKDIQTVETNGDRFRNTSTKGASSIDFSMGNIGFAVLQINFQF